MIRRILSLFRRRVTVRRAASERDVCEVVLDLGDGSTPFHRLLSRNDTFSTAAVCVAFMEDVARRGSRLKDVRDLRLTFTKPTDEEEPDVAELVVPPWAASDLFYGIIRVAVVFGWRGECPRPHPKYVYR